MLVDLKIENKNIVIVGGGSESYRKALSFVEAKTKILVVSEEFSENIKNLYKSGKIQLQKKKVRDAEELMKSFEQKPDLIVAVTNNHELNNQIISAAKTKGFMVHAPDNPAISDFTLPAVAKIGEVKIAISTSGKSPAMTRALRQKIERTITPEDLLQIKLQSYVRQTLKKTINDQKIRKEILYNIIDNTTVKKLLKEGKISEAEQEAEKIISKNSAVKLTDTK